MQLPIYNTIKKELLLDEKGCHFIQNQRNITKNIFTKKEKRLVIVVGPCSVHNIEETLLYAEKLKKIISPLKNLFVIMRFYIEKSRSAFNWKGFLYDPFLDGSEDVITGIKFARKALIELTKLKIPAAMEFIDPFLSSYFTDLITWGFIGSRSCLCQFYRQIAASLPFPMGFKNTPDGCIDDAIKAAIFAQKPQSCITLNDDGRLNVTRAEGNPFAHVVLRGSYTKPNFAQAENINFPLLVDCSHGNSQKNANNQKQVFLNVLNATQKNPAIIGVMLESNLYHGNQKNKKNLLPGISITDSCISLDETEKLLNFADSLLYQWQYQHQ